MARVRSITGGNGARVVFDPVGGDCINTLAQATVNGGTIFLHGALSGNPQRLNGAIERVKGYFESGGDGT